MSDNRTTELLREGLTERGVEYQAIGKRLTYWNRDGSHNDCDDADFVADEQNGYLIVEGLTPEQAIAATLGSKTCIVIHDLVTHDFRCSNCGKQIGVVRNCEMYETCDGQQAWKSLDHEVCDIPNFCPNCGAKVVKR